MGGRLKTLICFALQLARKGGRFKSTAPLLLVTGMVLSMAGQLLGLDPAKPVDHYLIDKWETTAGIPSDTIHSITQTPDGYLWVATEKGLARFDGIKFSVLSFTSRPGTSPGEGVRPDTLFVDREGTLWIGSTAGLTSYRYQTRQFTTFTPKESNRDIIRRLYEDMRGNIWVSFFTSYVTRFTNGEFTPFNASHGLEGKKVNAIIESRNGNLLFGSRENGIFNYKDGKFSKYPIANIGKGYIITLYEDRNGETWVGTSMGLFRVTADGTVKYDSTSGLSNDYITCILEDGSGNLWVGTKKGLNRVKPGEDGAIHVERLLDSFLISCLFEDKEKSMWLGTFSGIKRLKDSKFLSYDPSGALEQEIPISLFEDRGGDAWIGTLTGKLYRFRDGELIRSMELPGLSGTGISAIADDAEGNLWLGTMGKGVFAQTRTANETGETGETFKRFTTREGLADDVVTSITRDSRGNLWFSTSDGVSVIRAGSGEIQSLDSSGGLPGKAVNDVYEDSFHNIRISTNNGVTLLENVDLTASATLTGAGMKHYLKDILVTCVYQEPGNGETTDPVFWISTQGAGLKRFKDGRMTSYTTAEGMTTNFIYRFFEDHLGNFWFMSDSGVLRVSKKELTHFAEDAQGDREPINCISYGVSDGMKSPEFNNHSSRNSALKVRDGKFWFVTKKGIAVVDPGKIQINKLFPPVVIEDVYFDREPIPPDQPDKTYKDITQFRFQFTAPTFLSPGKVKFKYQLEGVDSQWVLLPPGSPREADYKGLRPGTYTFRVIACNSEGVWNRSGDSITFTLEPPFSGTLLFKGILLLAFLLLGAAGFYVYKSHLRKKEAAKKPKYKSSTINPHFAKECIKKMTHLMEVDKLYCDADLSLPVLAEKISLSPHQLSQLLNETLHRNFSDFINSYRIEEAKRVLLSPRGSQQKIAAIAFDVGFNTTVAFYNAFKKYTGMTPAQFKKQSGETGKKTGETEKAGGGS
ncbi:MAG: helix-turn-helix domain-containing protein [bacterium]|nr:helix-turn-helix domain-containing protein [bacterium]